MPTKLRFHDIKSVTLLVVTLIFFQFIVGCKKLVDSPLPANAITLPQAFSSDDLATSAMASVYSNLINGSGLSFARGGMTIYSGLSSDELKLFLQFFANDVQFQNNSLLSNNTRVLTEFWTSAYSCIYSSNAVIEGVQHSLNVRDSVKTELTAEAKFMRAFTNFYLTNLFGDIPIVNNTNWRQTNLLSRTPTKEVYAYIVNDLNEAINDLPISYSVGKGERIIPNKWAALALLARVNLFIGDWSNCESQASAVIDNKTMYDTVAVSNVFLKNSKEVIWQLKQSNMFSDAFNVTTEGYRIIPTTGSFPPFYLTQQLYNAFESNDKRKTWIDSTTYNGTKYYFPKKYKAGPAQAIANGPYTEYYVALRLGELYLIRAEARAKQNKLPEAISDINLIRQRAGLPLLSNSLTQQQIIGAIEKEKRIEFFAEWGHRWLDLKRWGQADAILSPLKGSNWQTTDLLYPIPLTELVTDPNLTQNDGY